jgi:nucleoside phosphorylase/tetratricopeptide (TPR) repeat protein
MPRADVLIVTAVPDEHRAVLEAGGGASAWTEYEGPMGLRVAFRDVDAEGGGSLTIAVTQALGMGGPSAVIAAAAALKEYEVRCLAMCGVCAGRRGDVALGDVIIADRVWQYDAGKRKAGTVDGERVVEEQQDIEMYRLHPPAWKQAAERFQIDPKAKWLARRPRSYEEQGDWILERVVRGADPVTDSGSKEMCADFDKALARLWKKELLADGTLDLTEAGRKHIRRLLLLNRNALPEPKPLRVHVGPIASGNQVMQDDGVFPDLAASVRKVLGIDMEVAAIAELARTDGLEYSVVMKAVMDHADADKSDNFKDFAARASAECLLAFVKQHVPPRATRDDSILAPGTEDLRRLASPANLLNACHQVVPFHGRKELLDELRRWCEGDERVRARLIHAAGGMGKTRLAIELCKQMREAGWRAGFVREDKTVADLLESHRPVLAVLDYAESRPDLRDVLAGAAGRRGKKAMRVVLLSRNADAWWTEVLRSNATIKTMLSEEEPLALPSATPDREAVFREAVTAFAGKAYEGPLPSLEHPRYERVLYVHTAALATAQERPVHVDALMDDTLDHEEHFWREQLPDRGRIQERKAVDKMRLAVAALTLKGGARDKAEAEHIVGDEDMVTLLRDLYPGRVGQRYVGGLEPDLLGEALVWRALSQDAAAAGPYLDRVFEGADSQAVRTGFTVLGRLSEVHEEAAAWIARVLAPDVAWRALEAFAAAKTVGERTAHAALGMELARALEREGTVELAERLELELPRADQTVSLLEVGRWVLTKRLAGLPEGSAQEERARILNNLGNWQSALGQREAALASTQEAIDIRRKLAQARPEAFLPKLAMSLTNLGNSQSALGQREAALASTQEAVDLRRKLVQARPEAFLPNLATSLTNLGAHQSALGQREEALASTQEAVDLYSKLAQARPETFLPALALSLNNLGNMQSALGQRKAALASSQEAVDIRRKLAQARPEAFLPDLAMSLNNLGNRQSALGQHEAALASTEEALDAIWPFFLRLPAAFERNTGIMLDFLRYHLAALGRPPPASHLDREATFAAQCSSGAPSVG